MSPRQGNEPMSLPELLDWWMESGERVARATRSYELLGAELARANEAHREAAAALVQGLERGKHFRESAAVHHNLAVWAEGGEVKWVGLAGDFGVARFRPPTDPDDLGPCDPIDDMGPDDEPEEGGERG
jgi:hypothetical protein